MDVNTIINWLKQIVEVLTQFVQIIQNPYFLIFFCALLLGWVLFNLIEKFPDWFIPATLGLLGCVSGCILLSTPGFKGHFSGMMMGGALALAATGFHQAGTKILNRFADRFKSDPQPATPKNP